MKNQILNIIIVILKTIIYRTRNISLIYKLINQKKILTKVLMIFLKNNDLIFIKFSFNICKIKKYICIYVVFSYTLIKNTLKLICLNK